MIGQKNTNNLDKGYEPKDKNKLTTSYLIVTKWQGTKIMDTHTHGLMELTKRIEAQGDKARKLAENYELKLNNGIDYSFSKGHDNLVKALHDNSIRFTVCAIPMSQAREYNNYLQWENAPIFEP